MSASRWQIWEMGDEPDLYAAVWHVSTRPTFLPCAWCAWYNAWYMRYMIYYTWVGHHTWRTSQLLRCAKCCPMAHGRSNENRTRMREGAQIEVSISIELSMGREWAQADVKWESRTSNSCEITVIVSRVTADHGQDIGNHWLLLLLSALVHQIKMQVVPGRDPSHFQYGPRSKAQK